MFLLSTYPIVKIAAMIGSLYGVQMYKNYKNLTSNQRNLICTVHTMHNISKRTIKDSKQVYAQYIKDRKQVTDLQVTDLIDTFTQANEIKRSFSSSLSKSQKGESWDSYIDKNQKPLEDYEYMLFEEIFPIVKKYTNQYNYPTKTELLKAIVENQ
jgi:hypothetical protein